MTVFRPSLPPLISSTTRMLSLPGAAARAVRATNCGTTAPRATSDEPCSVRVRSCRRVNILCLSAMGRWDEGIGGLCQVVFGHRQDGVDGLAHAAVEGGAGGP